MPTAFAVVIPIHASHLPRVSAVLSDIEAWNLKPTSIVLIISPWRERHRELTEVLCSRHASLNVLISRRRLTKTSGRARNIGWRLCTEQLIIFLDADDSYHPRYPEVLLHTQYSYDADVVLHSLTRDSGSWGKALEDDFSEDLRTTTKDEIVNLVRAREGWLPRRIGPVPMGGYVSHGTGLYTREVLEALPFSGRVTGQDTIMIRRVLRSRFSLAYVNAVIMYWRPGSSVSLLTWRRIRRIPSRLTVKLTELLHDFVSGGFSEEALTRRREERSSKR